MSALMRRGFLGAGAGGTVAALTTVGPAYAGAPDTAGETGRTWAPRPRSPSPRTTSGTAT